MSRALSVLLLVALFGAALADVYLHSPRGQNDRCDEKSNNRNNDQRCYNSQNNAAGGYGTCDRDMVFYTRTSIAVEWYSQHNCGNGARDKNNAANPENVICNHLLQIGCQEQFSAHAGTEEATYVLTDGKSLGRPGADAANKFTTSDDFYNTFGDTCTQRKPTSEDCKNPDRAAATCATDDLQNNRGNFNAQQCSCHPRKMQTYCYHEPEAFWLKCKARERNKGLFTANQNPGNNDGATRTRQEPNSARYGFECPEEKDYWPYWHPTPWMDLAVFVSNLTMCPYYREFSQNTATKCECVPKDGNKDPTVAKAAWAFNQQIPCEAKGHSWTCVQPWNWNKDFPCVLAPNQPDNSLAKVDSRGDNEQRMDGSDLAQFTWSIPDSFVPSGKDETKCIIRLRYNISSSEVPWNFDKNDNPKLTNNPVFVSDVQSNDTDKAVPLRLAINTAQFGRVFEDRTYSFIVRRTRPDGLQNAVIHNLNVRGKRGNIAQVRNCYEYDFIPHVLKASVGDYIHFQWCLTDYNDNGNAGEGRAGTDRVNVVPIATGAPGNVHINLTNAAADQFMFELEDVKKLAWIGQKPENCYTVNEMLTTQRNNGQGPKSCHFLNGARQEEAPYLPTSYFSHIAKVTRMGSMQFMSSRNNNFSNRSQKAAIVVDTFAGNLSGGAVAGIVIGAVVGVAIVAGLVVLVVMKFGSSKV